MLRFVLGISLEFGNKKYYIQRDMINFIDEEGVFDFRKFYKSNYPIFENDIVDNEIVVSSSLTRIRYYGFSFDPDEITVLTNDFNLNEYIDSDTINGIFFIQGGHYNIYDCDGKIIKKISFSQRIGKLGLGEYDFDDGNKISYIIYPSKTLDLDNILAMINIVNTSFPNTICGNNSKIQSSGDVLIDLSEIDSLIGYIKPFKEIHRNDIKIMKKQFNVIDYEINQDLENHILEMGGFDKISDEDYIPVSQKIIQYDIPENQFLLDMFQKMKDDFGTNIFDTIISDWQELGIRAVYFGQPPMKILQNQIFSYIYSFFLKSCGKKTAHYCLDLDLEHIGAKSVDSISSINKIYEIYCYIEFYRLLKKAGIIFTDDLRSIYDGKNIVRYEYSFMGGYLPGYFDKSLIRYYFGDRITPDRPRKYMLMDDYGFDFIQEKYQKVSKDGLSPDISLEFDNDIVFCDVKFSCFKDYDTGIEFPNPEYLFFELQKYRKVMIDGKLIDTPIIVFYPGMVLDINKYKLFHDMMLNSYNMFLIPMIPGNVNNHELEEFILNGVKKLLVECLG